MAQGGGWKIRNAAKVKRLDGLVASRSRLDS
jgi:hypothetical protein